MAVKRTKTKPVGQAVFSFTVRDTDIMAAYEIVKDYIPHTDAPDELVAALVRNELGIENIQMLSTFWLRNRIVKLRKGTKLSKQTKGKKSKTYPLIINE